MPEWPEAETNRRRIEAGCLNRTILSVEPGEDVTHCEIPGGNARGRFVGHQFSRTHRVGKIIFAGSGSGPWLAIHLGMAGSLRVTEGEVPKFTRLSVAFEGGTRLAFRDPRKFGWVRVVEDPAVLLKEMGWGPDAMEIGRARFREVIGGRGMVKPALLSQGKLAGIGNLWADEMLYRTGVRPEVKGVDLGEDRLDALYDAMREILPAVADTGARYGRLPDDWLIRNREAGAKCARCGGTIESAKVGGRTSYFCASHQS